MASSSLNVIALISGGKDSLFSILHCQANGHKVVALANLHPAPQPACDNEDIDSFMYQTVGHSIIPLYEQALVIPLFRQEITGRAVNSSRDYEHEEEQEQDETEDLVPLLRRVLEGHPEANAVSTGAILSTYQRTRVESVAWRLGLTPLSYLWQYPLLPPYTQSALLHDMAAVGQEAVIIKTASGGLDTSFLGLNVADRRTIARLSTTMARFGEADNGAIVGEGGEFETLALDGPKPLWKKRIKIEDSSQEVVNGGQTVLKIKASRLEDKSDAVDGDANALRIAKLFDVEFERILEASETVNTVTSTAAGDIALPTTTKGAYQLSDISSDLEHLPRITCHDTPTVFTYSNLVSDTRSSSSSSPSRQLTKILLRLDHMLEQWELLKSNINHCTLLLRNMGDFTTLNPVYGEYFNAVNPPARVTIAAGSSMPANIDVMLSIVLDKDETDSQGKTIRSLQRQGLHVQGRSYWAPANIGPYSQAISVQLPPTTAEQGHAGEIVYIAGQIPLIPASMSVYTDRGFKGQALLSLQHLWRIGRTKGVKYWTAAVGFIPASESLEEHVRIAQEMWKRVHTPATHEQEDDEDDAVDPWDRLNQHRGSAFNDTTYRAPIPDFNATTCPSDPSTPPVPPCFIAQVESLPRDVDIEWSATGLTSSPAEFTQHPSLYTSLTAPIHSSSRFYTFEIRDTTNLELWLKLVGEDGTKSLTSATLYAGRGFECDKDVGEQLKGVQWIPCKRVWGDDGTEVRGVLVGRADGVRLVLGPES